MPPKKQKPVFYENDIVGCCMQSPDFPAQYCWIGAVASTRDGRIQVDWEEPFPSKPIWMTKKVKSRDDGAHDNQLWQRFKNKFVGHEPIRTRSMPESLGIMLEGTWRARDLVLIARDLPFGELVKKSRDTPMSGQVVGARVDVLLRLVFPNTTSINMQCFKELGELQFCDTHQPGELVYDPAKKLIGEVHHGEDEWLVVEGEDGKVFCDRRDRFMQDEGLDKTEFMRGEHATYVGSAAGRTARLRRGEATCGIVADRIMGGARYRPLLEVTEDGFVVPYEGGASDEESDGHSGDSPMDGSEQDDSHGDESESDFGYGHGDDDDDSDHHCIKAETVVTMRNVTNGNPSELLWRTVCNKRSVVRDLTARNDTQLLQSLCVFGTNSAEIQRRTERHEAHVGFVMTTLKIRWQDGTMEECDSTALELYDAPDDFDLWPVDSVVMKDRPQQKGIVQTVDAAQRVATVRWRGADGKLTERQTEESLYELMRDAKVDIALGDLVLLLKNVTGKEDPLETVKRIGQIVEMRLDGKIKVACSFGRRDPVEGLYESSDFIRIGDANGYMDDYDGSEGSWDDEVSEHFHGMDLPWTDEHGNVAMNGGDWESEESDEGSDVDMSNDEMPGLAAVQTPIAKDARAYPPSSDKFKSFQVLDLEPVNHQYVGEVSGTQRAFLQRVRKDMQILTENCPPGVLVRSYESRMDLFRAVVFGPFNTPYEQAPMLFDLYLPPDYPAVPPQLFFHAAGIGRLNPNLYEDGTVCLSLLGTWEAARPEERWSKDSTLLQLFVSLQALVLVREPFYNEAGYEAIKAAGGDPVPSRMYTERAYLLSRMHVVSLLERSGVIASSNPADVPEFTEELRWYYLSAESDGLFQVIQRASCVMAGILSEEEFCMTEVSKGARGLLDKHMKQTQQILSIQGSLAPPAA